MRALSLAVVALSLAACESVPELNFGGDASSPQVGQDGAVGSDATPSGFDADVDGAPSGDDGGGGGDTSTSVCPAHPPTPYGCCGSVICRGHQNDCNPGNCAAQGCNACSAVCCLRNNGAFEQCADTIADCPAQ